jgi:hypothetical protein
MDWISAWISVSVFSSGASVPLRLGQPTAEVEWSTLTYSGAAFSFSAVFFDDFAFAILLKI